MTADQSIDAYLAEIAARLAGPRRTRAGILAELRSGLLDARDAQRSLGLTPVRAAEAAINQFGSAQAVADSFREELAVKQSRRLVAVLVATGAPISIVWAHAARLSDLGRTRAGASLWHFFNAEPVPLAVAAFLVAVLVGLAILVTTGRVTRWLPYHPRLATTAAAIGGFGAAAADLAILGLLAAVLLGLDRGGLAPAPVTTAAVASSIRLTLAPRGARRCLAASASLA